MNGRAIALTVVGFLIGALAAGGIGVRVIREVRTSEDATSLPPSNVSSTTTPPSTRTSEYFVDPNEVLISSTALVPLSIQTADGQVSVEYELVSIAPRAGLPAIQFLGNFNRTVTVEVDDMDHIYPRTWILRATNGETYTGGPANSRARTARIDVSDGFSPSEIESIEIVEALAPFPIDVPFTLSLASPRADIVPGVRVELLNVSDQGSSTIVQVEIEIDDAETAGFFVTGDGPGWRSAFFEAEGRRRVNLTWVGGELPEEIPLIATGTVWQQIEGAFTVTLEGIQ